MQSDKHMHNMRLQGLSDIGPTPIKSPLKLDNQEHLKSNFNQNILSELSKHMNQIQNISNNHQQLHIQATQKAENLQQAIQQLLQSQKQQEPNLLTYLSSMKEDMISPNNPSYIRHVESEGVTLWHCDLCNYKTEYASNLRIHSKSDKHKLAVQHFNHTSQFVEKNEKLKCPLCKIWFNKQEIGVLKMHLMTEHKVHISCVDAVMGLISEDTAEQANNDSMDVDVKKDNLLVKTEVVEKIPEVTNQSIPQTLIDALLNADKLSKKAEQERSQPKSAKVSPDSRNQSCDTVTSGTNSNSFSLSDEDSSKQEQEKLKLAPENTNLSLKIQPEEDEQTKLMPFLPNQLLLQNLQNNAMNDTLLTTSTEQIGQDDDSFLRVKPGPKPGGSRKPRTVFNDTQIQILMDSFKLSPYPNEHGIEKIAEMTQLDRRVIIIWFQNRRSKFKKKGDSHREFMQQQKEKVDIKRSLDFLSNVS